MYNLLAVLGIFVFIFGIIGIALYILYSYSLYKMAIKQGIENPWIAFIPIAQNYTLGKLIKNLKVFDFEIPRIEVVLPAATLIVLVFNNVNFIGGLLSLANFILMMFVLNKLYNMYKPENATLYTILSIIALPVPFILFSLKELNQVDNIQL